MLPQYVISQGMFKMKKTRVLIADDHAITRRGLRQILDTYPDLEIVGEAANGLETINKVFELEPDLIFLDISMPHLNGIEACIQILKSKPLTRIIMITMNDPEDYLLAALEAGAHGFLKKDAPIEEFKIAIDAVANGYKYLSPTISVKVINAYLDLRKNPQKVKKELLSVREKEVLTLIAEGYSSKEIADMISLSVKTVGTHRNNIMKKLGVHNTAEMVRYAFDKKLIVKGLHSRA